jgi:octaprenyl-diphosphate synthase
MSCRFPPAPRDVVAHPDLATIQALARDDMAAVDALIRAAWLRRGADQPGRRYIIGAGGKRLRPMLLLLRGARWRHAAADAHQLAAVIEFIHTATLLHDDVVDESDLRRGRKTANAVWGNAPACWSATSCIRAASS